MVRHFHVRHFQSTLFNVEKCRDLQIRVRDHSRLLKVVPFDRLRMISYWCSIVSLSLRRTGFFDFWLQKCRDFETRLWITQGHRNWHRSIRHPWLPINVT